MEGVCHRNSQYLQRLKWHLSQIICNLTFCDKDISKAPAGPTASETPTLPFTGAQRTTNASLAKADTEMIIQSLIFTILKIVRKSLKIT